MTKMDFPPLILLAAGKSRRMGVPKGLIKINDRNLIDYQLKAFGELGGNKVIVVLGAHFDEYQKVLPWVKTALNDWHKTDSSTLLRVARNENFELGQFSSLKMGMEVFLTLQDQYAFVLPIDVPCPGSSVWKTLMAKTGTKTHASIPEISGRGGHPVIISRKFANELAQLSPEDEESRLDLQIKKLDKSRVVRVVVEDKSIHANLNNPEKLQQYLSAQNLKTGH